MDYYQETNLLDLLMAVVAPTLKPVLQIVSQMQLVPGSRAIFQNVAWTEFESILAALGEHRPTRLAYSNGTLEIRMPGPDHEKSNRLITDIVKLLLDAQDRAYEDFGATTFSQPEGKGVESDTCFYIQNVQQVFDRRRWQPSDPPPDLAIETDVSSKTAMDAYEALGVMEVWVYADKQLSIHVLQRGKYEESETSPTFPGIPVKQLIVQGVERAWEVGRYQAFKELRDQVTKILHP